MARVEVRPPNGIEMPLPHGGPVWMAEDVDGVELRLAAAGAQVTGGKESVPVAR